MTKHQTQITIIIPTYTNTGGFIELLTFLSKTSVSIIVIDNQPTEKKQKFVQSLITNYRSLITYLPQQNNTGFAKAVNLGIKKAKSEWVLILNDDVIIKDKYIFEQLLAYAIKHEFSAVSPFLKNSTGKIENLGYRVLPAGRAELNFDKTKIDQRSLDGLTAACLLIKKNDFDTVGGFDEHFFAYLEDVDLFLRLKKKGYTFGVDLAAEVIHESHATSSKMGNFKQKQDLKNWIRIIIRNWDKKTLISHFPQIVIERMRNVSGYIKAI